MERNILLIIDDSELDLAVLRVIFQDIFKVKCVSNGKEAMAFITQNYEKIAAVLLDICLGKKGAGLLVLADIKKKKAISDLPVFLITTDAKEDYVLAGIHQGACDFLAKPVDPSSVRERVCEKVKSVWAEKDKEFDIEDRNTILLSSDPLYVEDAERAAKDWLQQMTVLCKSRKVFPVDRYKRIQKITTVLAKTYVENHKEKGLDEEDARLIGLAATFYDIGLMGLPDTIIEGGEKQDEPNRSIYFEHTSLGRDLFSRDRKEHLFLQYCADIAYWHHKNYDGTGYPIEEYGEDIPLCAQFVRTALICDNNADYYHGIVNYEERLLSTLAKEVGHSISKEMYQTVLDAKSALSDIMFSK